LLGIFLDFYLSGLQSTVKKAIINLTSYRIARYEMDR
jgi:hypothetical protein